MNKKKIKIHDPYSSSVPTLKKGEFVMDFSRKIREFESATQALRVKDILYQYAFSGKGLEFDSYRDFDRTSEDSSLIDWKASLRANKLLSKNYVEERNLNIYFLLDVSNSMLFGSGSKLKAEYAAEMIVSLSRLMISSGDKVGLIMFSDKIVKTIHPSNSKNQFAIFMRSLSDPSLYGGGFNLDRAMDSALRTINSPYTTFILVSDFIRTRKDLDRRFMMVGSKFETIAIMIRDKMDENLPKINCQIAVQDPYTGKQVILDPSIAEEKFKLSSLKHKGMLKDLFRRSKIDLLELSVEKSFTLPISSFLKNRTKGGRI
jgi:uncharacterized protein (DUF58 family)|tara:strand:- start:1190 stop:2140 length:951 start_codon:yes stop_codon:yes gene_type:complete